MNVLWLVIPVLVAVPLIFLTMMFSLTSAIKLGENRTETAKVSVTDRR